MNGPMFQTWSNVTVKRRFSVFERQFVETYVRRVQESIVQSIPCIPLSSVCACGVCVEHQSIETTNNDRFVYSSGIKQKS